MESSFAPVEQLLTKHKYKSSIVAPTIKSNSTWNFLAKRPRSVINRIQLLIHKLHDHENQYDYDQYGYDHPQYTALTYRVNLRGQVVDFLVGQLI